MHVIVDMDSKEVINLVMKADNVEGCRDRVLLDLAKDILTSDCMIDINHIYLIMQMKLCRMHIHCLVFVPSQNPQAL